MSEARPGSADLDSFQSCELFDETSALIEDAWRYAEGEMFRFIRNRFWGSYFALISARRSKFCPYEAWVRSSPSSAV